MTIEQKILFLKQKYDFSKRKIGKVHGCSPRVLMEFDSCWRVRMVSSGNQGCCFWDGSSYVEAVVSGETQEEALEALENLCAEQKAAGGILVDPASVRTDGKSTKRVTLSDIARKVGCSRAAVSFAILGKHSISDKLKMKIFAELERSNYKPSAGRKMLPRKPVVLLRRIYEGETDGEGQLASLLLKKGYTPLLCFLPLYDPLNEEGMAAFAQIQKVPNLAGILSMHPALESMDILRYSQGVPVTISSRPDSMLSNAYYDFSAAGELVASLISEYKHRKTAFVSYGEVDGKEYQLLTKGLKKRKKGISIEVFDIPVLASDCCLQTAVPLLNEAYAKGCTFFFAQSEEHCVLVKQWAEQTGLAVPEDISLLYMNYERVPEHLLPKASSLELPYREIHKAVVEEMVCKIEHKPLPQKVFQPSIKDGGTVGICRIGNKNKKRTK